MTKREPRELLRIVLTVTDAFVALTAIGGGIALAADLEGGRFSAAWLADTPFGSYLEPGLILAVVVGGSAAAALVATLRSPVLGARLSVVAGLVLIGWILAEIAILTRDGELVSGTEAVYLVLGLAMIGLGYRLGDRWPLVRAQ